MSEMNSNICPGKRILMFAPAFAPFSFSESIVNSKLALAFQAYGWDVDIISKTEVWSHYSTEWHLLWQPLKDSTHIIQYPVGNSAGRLLDLLRQTARMHFPIDGVRWAGRAIDFAMALHKEHPYQLVLSRSPSDIGHVPALGFSKRTKVPWIANWNDPPAHLWIEPYKSKAGLLKRVAHQRLVDRVFDEASVVTFPSERLCRHVLQIDKNGCERKVQIVPHIGLSGYKPSKRKVDGCFRICHAGNLSKERDPKTFFEGIACFIKNTAMSHAFEIHIIGASSHELTALAARYDIEKHLQFSGGLNYLDTLVALEQNNVLAVVEAPCKEGIFLPSKVVDYAQVGRPILSVSPAEGTMADLIRETQAGELAICGDPYSIASSISALYTSWKNGQLDNDYPTEPLWVRFRPENIINKYIKMFSEVGL